MLSRSLYIKIIGYVALIAVFSLLTSWLLITGTSYFFSFVGLTVILLITLLLIRLINQTNKRLSFFFDSLRNNDSTLFFPEKTKDPFLRNLYSEMNRITSLFSESKAEVEEKRLYYESILRVLTHEIRNSITPITSLSSDLLNHTEAYTPEQLHEGLEVIHSQAKGLTNFLDSYHRLTHLPDPERRTVELQQLFHKLNRLLQAEPNGHQVYYAPSDMFIQADPNLLTLALINLIRNAIQAVSNQADGKVIVETYYKNNRATITITDNGPGIPPEQLSVVFTPFFSTKEGGSGIGLSLSRRIMQLHGGELTVTSEPGERTSFMLTF